MPETIRTDWPDIWFTAFHEVEGEYSVNFRIHSWDGAEIGDDDELLPVFKADDKPVMAGYVKHDGCNEWDTADGSLHFCTREGAQKLAQAIERCWDLAAATLQRTKQ
jgi:hypothetical protein